MTESTQRWFRWHGDDLLLSVRVIPRSTRAGLDRIENGRLRVRVTAAPADGNATAELIALLAETWSLAKTRVLLVRGQGSRNKTLRLTGPLQPVHGDRDDVRAAPFRTAG